mgnify:CR=1 FL=1
MTKLSIFEKNISKNFESSIFSQKRKVEIYVFSATQGDKKVKLGIWGNFHAF